MNVTGILTRSAHRPPRRSSSAAEPMTWRSAIGTHFLGPQSSAFRPGDEQWLGMTRGIRLYGDVWPTPDVTDGPHSGIAPTVGRFSGKQRFYDFEGAITGINLVEAVQNAVSYQVDLIWATGSASSPVHADAVDVLRNDPQRLMDCLHACATYFNTGAYADLPIRIYWEIGSAVNLAREFCLAERDEREPENDIRNAADYAENYLRPATIALQTASAEIYNDPRRILVVGAGVWQAQREGSREFLAAVLNHEYDSVSRRGARKDLAPFSGVPAWHTFDLFGVQYTDADHRIMDKLHTDYVTTGKMRGFINTEELGRRGRGDYLTAQVSARYLDFWLRRGWDSETGRILFWGTTPQTGGRRRNNWGVETTGRTSLELLGSFLGQAELSRPPSTEVRVDHDSNIEAYTVRADPSTSERRYLTYLAPTLANCTRVSAVKFFAPSGAGLGTLDDIAVSIISTTDSVRDGNDHTVESDDEAITLRLSRELDPTEALVIRTTFTQQA